ncbi:hypothetical protein FRC12_023987 [Ceratobasidium sp. 428]|nr:hypothetical protein FRC12_023987 [Ceratobasidium sp. 428]
MPEFQPGNEPGAAPKPIPPPPPPDPVRPPPSPPSHSALGSSRADELGYNSAGASYEESALTDGGTTSPQIELPLKPDADYEAPCAPLSATKQHPASPLVPPRPKTPSPPPAPKNHSALNGHQPPPPPVTPPPQTPKNKVVLPKVQALKFGPDEAPKPVPPKPHPDPVPVPPPPPQRKSGDFNSKWACLNGVKGFQELLKILHELGGHKPPPPPITPPPKPPKTSKFGPGGPPKPLPPHPDPVRPPPRPRDLLYQPGSLCAYANEWSCRSAHRVLGGRELEFATSPIATI